MFRFNRGRLNQRKTTKNIRVGAGFKPAPPTLKFSKYYSNFPRILLRKNIEKAIRTKLDILSAARIKQAPNTPRSGTQITPVSIAPKMAPM